jgi:hypothetical protein
MKPTTTTYLALLLLALSASAALGETKCYTVEHPDYNEAVCTGDEKAVVEKTEPGQVRTRVAEAVQVQSVPKAPAMPPAERGPAKIQPVSTISPALQAPSPGAGGPARETAAEHLAKRKALALKNKARISGAADTAIPAP